MKAIRCREWGAPDVLRLEEAESPNLKQHQVRLRVRAAGVNFADSLMVGGTYQVKPQFPFTPGLEAAGEIVETGSALDGLRVGQRAELYRNASPQREASLHPTRMPILALLAS
jgi:NADPH2:quinone reductase